MNKNAKILLILGCQRSGTTLLASMLGRHPEINMLFESFSTDVFRLIGKKYSGNKLLSWRQIRMTKRASKVGHLINRFANWDFLRKNKFHKRRIYPISVLSVKDYLDNNAILITIARNEKDVINSIVSRTLMNAKQAKAEYDLSMNMINELKPSSLHVEFNELVLHPKETMKKLSDKLKLEYHPTMLEGPKYNFVYPNQEIIKEKASHVDKTN